MQANGVYWRLVGLVLGVGLLLGACTHGHHSSDAAGGDDEEINVYPTNYKGDILAAMHVYLNDPTGIRDAGISDPALKPVGSGKRYVVCLRFNAKTRFDAKKGSVDYAGVEGDRSDFYDGPVRPLRRDGARSMRGRDLCAVPRAGKAVALKPFIAVLMRPRNVPRIALNSAHSF